MDPSTSNMTAATAGEAAAAAPKKQARLAGLPPSLPTKGPSNINDHHQDDDAASDAESDFDESTIKTEGGLISKLENLDERTFEDKKKVALREIENGNDATKDVQAEEEDEETSNAGEQEQRWH